MTWQHPRPHRPVRLRVALLLALITLLVAAPAVLAGNTGISPNLRAGFSIASASATGVTVGP